MVVRRHDIGHMGTNHGTDRLVTAISLAPVETTTDVSQAVREDGLFFNTTSGGVRGRGCGFFPVLWLQSGGCAHA